MMDKYKTVLVKDHQKKTKRFKVEEVVFPTCDSDYVLDTTIVEKALQSIVKFCEAGQHMRWSPEARISVEDGRPLEPDRVCVNIYLKVQH